jgi:hypothetical protein
VANTQVKTQPVVDFNVMARRALKDEMPAMLMRSATRAIVKGVVQDQAQKKLGLLGGLVTAAASIVTEQADDRMWRMLPERVYVARAYLPPGTHKISIDGRELPEPVVIDGQYALVPVRVYTNNLVVGDVASFGKLAATAVAAPEPAKPAETTRVMSTTTRSSTATSGARSNRATAPATANTGTAKSAPTVAPKPAPAATTPAAKPAVKPAGGVPTKAPAP